MWFESINWDIERHTGYNKSFIVNFPLKVTKSKQWANIGYNVQCNKGAN